ncbi:hypothetical protein N7495_001020, partial [Penicillium taxi]|uniref:uncharacterized protein n=1 Tax=Penicillium taxi TaxID=168475 RepID=UPI002545355E
HNVPSDAAKRTPLACQACRRRKTKCDSGYPCTTCADSGEACVRKTSSVQLVVQCARSWSEKLIGEEMNPPLGNKKNATELISTAEFITAQVKATDFDHFHQAWPWIYVPTFAPDKQNTLLTSALANLFIWMQNANHHHFVPDAINQRLTLAFMPKAMGNTLTGKPADVPLQTLQALVTILTYAILNEAQTTTLTWVAQWTDIFISTFRRIRALDNRWPLEGQQQSNEECWVLKEQMKRLVYTVLRIDTYLSLILDRPPTMRYQEIELPLPVSEDIWRAEKMEAGARLHWHGPTGLRCAFSTVIRDGLERQFSETGYIQMPHLSLEHENLRLCAFLSELWGISREAQNEQHLNYLSPKMNRTSARVKLWKGYLHNWWVHIGNTDKLEDSFFADAPADWHPFLGLNLTLYHLLCLKMFANLRMLEFNKCSIYCREADIDNATTTWAQSTDGRQAVYHAVQLKCIYEREKMLYNLNNHQVSNVLWPIGLLTSAIVLCVYIKVSGVAEGDAMITSGETIELTQSRLVDTPEFDHWISEGGMATMDGVPLYAFSVPLFSSWYQEQLKTSPLYSSRLASFLLTLKISYSCSTN